MLKTCPGWAVVFLTWDQGCGLVSKGIQNQGAAMTASLRPGMLYRCGRRRRVSHGFPRRAPTPSGVAASRWDKRAGFHRCSTSGASLRQSVGARSALQTAVIRACRQAQPRKGALRMDLLGTVHQPKP